GYDPLSAKTVALDAKKVAIMPNPANDLVNLKLELDGINKSVAVRMLDWTGRVVSLETRRNIQNETFTFDTANLPSGVYMMWISTEEGTAVKKVAVCH
ncbi:MAG: T9SS type A sorting domain-containing protein, partial [Saprospiraceae bacterium]